MCTASDVAVWRSLRETQPDGLHPSLMVNLQAGPSSVDFRLHQCGGAQEPDRNTAWWTPPLAHGESPGRSFLCRFQAFNESSSFLPTPIKNIVIHRIHLQRLTLRTQRDAVVWDFNPHTLFERFMKWRTGHEFLWGILLVARVQNWLFIYSMTERRTWRKASAFSSSKNSHWRQSDSFCEGKQMER